MKYSAFGQKQNKGHITISNGDLYNKAEPPADSEFLSLLRISEFFFSLYSRLLADFLSHFGKWVRLIKFEA